MTWRFAAAAGGSRHKAAADPKCADVAALAPHGIQRDTNGWKNGDMEHRQDRAGNGVLRAKFQTDTAEADVQDLGATVA